MKSIVNMLDSHATAPAELAEGVYALTTSGSICYLVTGSKSGLVIDTGFGAEDALAAARKATDLPLVLVNTHGHSDHIGCNEKFEKAYAHEREQVRVSRKNKEIGLVKEGFVFDLGGRKLEVIGLPGHTPGCIALFDRENRMIFTGDMLYNGTLFLQFEYSSLDDYIASMDKLLAMSDLIDYVFVCHGTEIPMKLDAAEMTRALAQLVKDGKLQGEPVHLDTEDGGYDVKRYSHDGAALFYK